MPFLHDFDVVEYHPSLADAMVGRYLADLGARVTTIDAPGGHPARREPPFTPGGASLLHAYLAHGKAVAHEGDSAELLRSARLVVHPYAQAEFERLTGLAPREGPPCVSVMPTGERGPGWGDVPELAVDALSGNLWLNGFPDRPPLAMYGHQPAFFPALAGVVAALGLSLTPNAHRATVSALQVQASVLEDAFLRQQMLGQPISRQGNRWRNPSPFLDLYPTKDGAVAISVYLEPQWESFCALLDRHDWLADPAFATWESRRVSGDVIEQALRAWFRERDSQDAFDLLQTYRIPCAVLLSPAELLQDAQAVARGAFESIPLPDDPATTVSVPALPWRADTSAPPVGGRRRGVHLDRLRVLDFTHAWAGPWGARTLADLGMDVIRVESGVRPDPTRLGANAGEAMVGVPATERSIWFQQYSVNKRSISLEVTDPAGYEVLMRLVEQSDVVIDNFSARVMPQLGLGFDKLSAVNPRIVQVRLTGYGGTGPLQNTVAYGEPLESATGLVYLTRSGGNPVRSGIAYPDVVGGYHGAIAALAGLHYREATGHGVLVDLSERDATMRLVGEAFAEASRTGQNAVRESSELHDTTPAGVFRTAVDEEWIALSCPDAAWQALAVLTGAPDLASLSRELRSSRRDDVTSAVTRWSAGRRRGAVLSQLAAIGVLAWPVVSTSDVVLGEDWRAAGAVVPVEHPLLGRFHLPVPPITLNGVVPSMRHAPLFGEHTAEVLRDVLGLDDTDIKRLTDAGAINRVPTIDA